MLNDAHCHYFSSQFYRTLGHKVADLKGDAAVELPSRLGWTAPGSDNDLADAWIAELDQHGVNRAVVIASVPGDEGSVSAAVARHPQRFVGAFMFNPCSDDSDLAIERAFQDPRLRMACLFPAMHGCEVDGPETDAVFAAAQQNGRAVFVHCGVLQIGIRKKLGLPSPFDLRLGDPLAVAAMAVHYPEVPVIIPHFGAGLFREALMAASAAPNILLDTSSSNNWIKLHPNLTLSDVYARALDVVGPSRLLFGTDSSFFPRGWQKQIHEAHMEVLTNLDVDLTAQHQIFGGNFERVFGA